MKKALLLLFLLSHLSVCAVVLTSQPRIPDYSVNVIKIGNKLRVHYRFDSVAKIPDPVFSGCFNLCIAGFGNSAEETKPALPVLLERFAVPLNCTYSVQVLETGYTEYYGILLAPARPGCVETSPYSFVNVPVEPIAIVDSYEPSKTVTDCGSQIFKKQQVANIRIAPIAYNSASGNVRVYQEIRFELEFIENESGLDVESNFEDEYFIKSITIQPTEDSANKAKVGFRDNMRSRSAEIDYLVLTPNDLYEAANSFVDWKRKLGYNVTLWSEESWSKDKVENVIASWYASAKNPSYVLFFGDHKFIMPYYRNSYLCDFKYSCMDGEDDNIADFCIGRIPAETYQEAQNAVNKILSYEANPLGRMTETKAVYCTYFDDSDKNGYEDRDYTRTTERIYQAFPTRFDSRQRIYYCDPFVNPARWSNSYSYGEKLPNELLKPVFKWNGNMEQIISAINDGCNLFLHRDHGDVDRWVAPVFYTGDLAALNNDTYPIVLSVDCLTGNYAADNNFAKTMLCMPGGGCASIIAASHTTDTNLNDAFVCSMFGSLFPEEGFRYEGNITSAGANATLFNGRASSIGEMLNIGLINMERYHPYSEAESQVIRNSYHCLGDPSLAVCWNASKVLAQKASITEFGGYITVDLCGLDAYISFYDSSTSEHRRVYGNYATFEAGNPDKVFVSVTRPGWIPLVGTYNQIRTIGTDNPKANYIDSYEIIDNTLIVNITANFDASFGAGTTWKLNTYIQSGVNAVLVSSMKVPPHGTPAVITLPQIRNGDIVRLTLTCGDNIVDKKSILIRR